MTQGWEEAWASLGKTYRQWDQLGKGLEVGARMLCAVLDFKEWVKETRMEQGPGCKLISVTK